MTNLIKNNPATYAENQQDFLAAFARSAYYEARSHAENGDLPDARRVFKQYRFNNCVYFCIYIFFWLPKTFWMNFNFDNLKRNPVVSWLVLRVLKNDKNFLRYFNTVTPQKSLEQLFTGPGRFLLLFLSIIMIVAVILWVNLPSF